MNDTASVEKIKLIADTPSDIPDRELARYHIDMPSVPITVDGKGFFERRSFTIQEFYQVLEQADEIPTTSRVPESDFLECYGRAQSEGYTSVIVVTINAGGSSTNASAHMARDMFFKEHPDMAEGFRISIVDSKTYTMAYGYPVVQAAKMAERGKSTEEILAYLEDWFSSADIYLGCYSLEYAKRSGRIGAAAAFVGDMLGLRPVIRMVDGTTKTVAKVRGDRKLVPRLFETYLANRVSRDAPVIVIYGGGEAPGRELRALIENDCGRKVPMYQAGAAIVINSGPQMVAVICHSKR